MKNPRRVLLGVNIDHVATLREARGTMYPDPVQAAFLAEEAGADGITIHLREDCRHIQTRDVFVLANTLSTRMNFEMAVTEAMMTLAEEIEPEACCFVPEKREELTTEGGLDVLSQMDHIRKAVARMENNGSEVSLFIDPDIEQIKAADRKSTRLNSSHVRISYAVFCLKKKSARISWPSWPRWAGWLPASCARRLRAAPAIVSFCSGRLVIECFVFVRLGLGGVGLAGKP